MYIEKLQTSLKYRLLNEQTRNLINFNFHLFCSLKYSLCLNPVPDTEQVLMNSNVYINTAIIWGTSFWLLHGSLTRPALAIPMRKSLWLAEILCFSDKCFLHESVKCNWLPSRKCKATQCTHTCGLWEYGLLPARGWLQHQVFLVLKTTYMYAT